MKFDSTTAAVVTGGASGLGRATAEALSAAGVKVAIFDINEALEADISKLEVGDNVKISNITLPEGAEPVITDRDFTIATIVAPSALKSSDGDTTKDEGEAAEGEA